MKNKKTSTEETFNFWKGNKISGHFQLTGKELIEKFMLWLIKKEIDWLEYYPMEVIVPAFITEELDSVGNYENKFAEYRQMENILRPFRDKVIEPITKK